MGNRCMKKSLCVMSDDGNFKTDTVMADAVQNTGGCSQAWGHLERNVNNFNAALFNDNSKINEESAEASNQIDNAKLSFRPEMILRPVEDSYSTETKRLCLDKDNDITIISMYPTNYNNFQDLINYNTVHNGLGSFINNSKCLNINLNNQIPFIPMIYNGSIQQSTIPNYITISDVIPNKTIKTDHLNIEVISQNCKESNSTLEVQENVEGDDDVVFVKEYKIENSECTNQKIKAKIDEKNKKIDKNENQNSESLSSNRGRKRRDILVETRKNPLRKAQMDKASIKLAENLSIPPAVFNARIPNKKSKQVINNQKAVRQSCRTTGAILCPPSPLNKNDFKEWPTDGLHEIPWYNEQTGTIEKFNRSSSNTKNERNKIKQCSSRDDFLKKQLSNQYNYLNRGTVQKKLSVLAHNRLHLSLDYINELKEFNSLTRCDKMNEDVEEQKGLDNVSTILYDTCELYSLLNNTDILSVAKYIESLNDKTSNS